MASRRQSRRATLSSARYLGRRGAGTRLATSSPRFRIGSSRSSRAPFREPGVPRDEVMFVRAGHAVEFKTDGGGRRQIVALRFPGEGILPREGAADTASRRSSAARSWSARRDFDPIVEANPELQRFFWRPIQRNEAIGTNGWSIAGGAIRPRGSRICCAKRRRGCTSTRAKMVNPFTQQQIADITGQTSVNVNRVFADMERRADQAPGPRDPVHRLGGMRRVASFQPAYLCFEFRARLRGDGGRDRD